MAQLLERSSKVATATAARMRRTPGIACGAHGGDPRWQLAERIAGSGTLGRSRMLVDFLLYIVDRQICDRSEEITEQQIGVLVFGRPEGYDSNEDNIVRSYARNLRKRLDEYFAEEGSDETLRIEIPRGGYVPVFHAKGAEQVQADQVHAGQVHAGQVHAGQVHAGQVHAGQVHVDQVRESGTKLSIARTGVEDLVEISGTTMPDGTGAHEADEAECIAHQGTDATDGEGWRSSPTAKAEERAKPSRRAVFRRVTWYVAGSLCMVTLGVLLGYTAASGNNRSSTWFKAATPSSRINRIFWDQLFEEKRDTFIVPADGGLVMLQSFIKQHVSLEDYASGSYRKESAIAQGIVGLTESANADDAQKLVHKVEVLGKRRYTSIADLELTARLARLSEVVPERLIIRYARDLTIDDLRTGNAILIGSIEANPWANLFQQQLNFQFQHGIDFGGSATIVNLHPLSGEHPSYASVPNDPWNRTYGVIDYVPNLDGTGHVLMIAGVNMAGTQAAGEFLLNPELMGNVLKRAQSANGAIRPFEVLFETSSVAANASRTTILSMRIEPS